MRKFKDLSSSPTKCEVPQTEEQTNPLLKQNLFRVLTLPPHSCFHAHNKSLQFHSSHTRNKRNAAASGQTYLNKLLPLMT